MLWSGFSAFLYDVLPTLAVIFLAVLAAIFLIRIILAILLHFARKKYQKIVRIIKSKKTIKAQKVLPKNDEELFRKKQKPGKLVEKMPSQTQEAEEEADLDTQIVDIVKPVGFWTSMMLGQKMTYLISSAKLMNKNSHKGFWVSMVEAQEKAQGRQKGRSL